jgi:hypothetical protein
MRETNTKGDEASKEVPTILKNNKKKNPKLISFNMVFKMCCGIKEDRDINSTWKNQEIIHDKVNCSN